MHGADINARNKVMNLLVSTVHDYYENSNHHINKYLTCNRYLK